jgi:hypothetical protein
MSAPNNATFKYSVKARNQSVAVLIAKLGAISLQPDLDGFQACRLLDDPLLPSMPPTPMLTICDDVTVEDPVGSGIVVRTVKLRYSGGFVDQFPEPATRAQVLRPFGVGILTEQLPGDVDVSVIVDTNDCP